MNEPKDAMYMKLLTLIYIVVYALDEIFGSQNSRRSVFQLILTFTLKLVKAFLSPYFLYGTLLGLIKLYEKNEEVRIRFTRIFRNLRNINNNNL